MSKVSVVVSTPDSDKILGYVARVSNPANQDNPDVAKLLRYCASNAHWSVFEHAFVTLEIETTRDIARQMLRHRSFSFSEFSQRYADVSALPEMELRECRLQDAKNRQNSIECEDSFLIEAWECMQRVVWANAIQRYQKALRNGIAKEQARALLPEGLTPSRLYMSGSLRSWITYCQVRMDPSTQKEHRLIAQAVLAELRTVAPITMAAFFPGGCMTDREAMQQALDALKVAAPCHNPAGTLRQSIDNAIAALRSRMEQPEQEPVAWCRLAYNTDGSVYADNLTFTKDSYCDVPLYTTPPAAAPLHPLTDEEILDCGPCQPDAIWSYIDQIYFARAVEAKLREKNGGAA